MDTHEPAAILDVGPEGLLLKRVEHVARRVQEDYHGELCQRVGLEVGRVFRGRHLKAVRGAQLLNRGNTVRNRIVSVAGGPAEDQYSEGWFVIGRLAVARHRAGAQQEQGAQ